MIADTDSPGTAIVQLENVHRRFKTRRGVVHAVNGVSLSIEPGQTLAVVGETGSGKSTLAKILLGLDRPSEGSIVLWGRPSDQTRGRELREQRRRLGAVFQDPRGSLNPRISIEHIIAEPLVVHHVGTAEERRARVAELLDAVGLNDGYARRRASSLSGGQAQRVAIARSLALDPDLMVLDEPVSALDVSVQAQVMNLLISLRERFGFAILFITHDLGVVRQIADRVAVMYLGRIVELGDVGDVLDNPQHPYSLALLSSVMDFDDEEPDRILLSGDPPSPISPPSGCMFRTRCFRAQDRCAQQRPELDRSAAHAAACWFPGPLGSWSADAAVSHDRITVAGPDRQLPQRSNR